MATSSDDLSDLGSSDLSSLPSRSPSPPAPPSPQLSQDSVIEPSDDHPTLSRKRRRTADDDARKKKRKLDQQDARIAERLDLRFAANPMSSTERKQLDRLCQALRERRKIVVIAGAGISTAAGIPDFRSSNGLFSSLRSEKKLKASGKHLFDVSVYQTDSATASFHAMVRTLSSLVKDAHPTEFHHLLATLAQENRLLRLYTQNVDGIDTALPPLNTSVPLNVKPPWPRTVQLHGSLEKTVCSKCNTLSPFDGSLFSGPLPPSCVDCRKMDEIRTDHAGKRSHGIGRLRPRMVLYNEPNPDEEAIGRIVTADLRARPDTVIVVGTSLEIPGVKRIAKEMCGVVKGRKNGLTVWISRNPPPTVNGFEDLWDMVVAGDCDQVAREVGMRRWNEEPPCDHIPVTDSEAEQAKAHGDSIHVVVNTPKKPTKASGMITPEASPKLAPTDKPRTGNKPKPKLASSISKSPSRSSSRAPRQPKATAAKARLPKQSKARNSKPITHTGLKINFKVGKPQQSSLVSTKPQQSLISDIPALSPISSLSARNNGPIMPNIPKELTPSMSSGESTPVPEFDIQTPETMSKLMQTGLQTVPPR